MIKGRSRSILSVCLAVIGILALLAVFSMANVVSKRDITVTRMDVIEMRARAFWASNGAVPNKLSDLPKLSDRDSSIIDGWGKEIRYQMDGTKITLSSSGADECPIEYSFDVIKKDERHITVAGTNSYGTK